LCPDGGQQELSWVTEEIEQRAYERPKDIARGYQEPKNNPQNHQKANSVSSTSHQEGA